MKRFISCALVAFLAIMFVFSASAFAQDHNALRKLSRGVCNTFGGFFWELFNNIEKSFQDEGVVVGATYGVGAGLLKGIGRTLVGVWELVTFPFPTRSYEPILDDPEFPFQIEKLKDDDSEYY